MAVYLTCRGDAARGRTGRLTDDVMAGRGNGEDEYDGTGDDH